MRGQDRYCCSTHVMTGSCSNGRGIRRTALEEPVLAGLEDHQIVPDIAAEAVRAWAEETNRLNRERSASGEEDSRELTDIERKKATKISVFEDGGYVKAMIDCLRELEARQEELKERLSTVPPKFPDIHPNIVGICRQMVARLAEALEKPNKRDAAASAIRGLIERIVLVPGTDADGLHVTLQGDFGRSSTGRETGTERNQPTLPARECRSRW